MEEYVAYFHTKYPHIKVEDLQILEGRAKEILVHLLFKSSTRITESQQQYAYENNKYWLYSAIQEMIERLGMTSAVSYSENGISIRFDSAQLSSSLINEIVPFVEVK